MIQRDLKSKVDRAAGNAGAASKSAVYRAEGIKVMQAIRTRYHGPTDFRGARMSAGCQAGDAMVPYDHELDLSANHAAARAALVKKLGWDRLARDGRWEGGVFGGDYYWVARS